MDWCAYTLMLLYSYFTTDHEVCYFENAVADKTVWNNSDDLHVTGMDDVSWVFNRGGKGMLSCHPLNPKEMLLDTISKSSWITIEL